MAATSSRRLGRSHQHEPGDRGHHRAADALEEAASARRSAARSEKAQQIEPAMNTTMAARKTFLAPNLSAIQPESGMKMASADEIRGQRKLERNRLGTDIGGNRRQRGSDDGRVHVFHEQGDREDERDDLHGRLRRRPSEALLGSKRWGEQYGAAGAATQHARSRTLVARAARPIDPCSQARDE